MPLVRQTWLCRKSDRAIALRVVPDRAAKKVRFDIVSADSPAELDFDPADHSDRGDAECPFCGATISAREVKECGKVGKLGTQLMALVGLVAGTRGRVYLPADAVALPSASDLAKRLSATGEEWPGVTGLQMPLHDSLNFKLPLYGVSTFDAMFSDRQTIAMLEFSAAIRRAYDSIADEVHDDELAKAVVTYLAISLDKLADNCCMYATWESTDQIVKHTFSQQVLKMIWDFAEVNPFENVAGSFLLALKSVALAAKGLASSSNPATCIRASATDLDLPDDTFDGVITDPPYYDNISYADLSDFFYVWLKRTLGVLYPEHFRGEQTPKKQEATVTPHRHEGDDEAARSHYEKSMTAAFREAGRVVKPGAPVVVVYAHKTVAGWATAVESLRRAECMVTEAWPLRTESDARLNARNTAALATSIFLVARKRTEEKICNDYDEGVLPLAHKVVDERVATLWAHGITGADLVIAVIGAALGPFTEFSVVRRANGAEVQTGEFLEEAQRMALDAILRKVIRTADEQTDAAAAVNAIDPISRLYVVARLQFGEAPADYDIFKNLAIGALPSGMELDGMKGALMQGKHALLAKKGSKVSIHSFVERGAYAELGLFLDGKPAPLIDVLHRLLWLQKNLSSEVAPFVKECGADLEAVRLLAQALGGRPLRAEPTPGAQKDTRTEEQRAIDTLLATMQDLGRAAKTQEPLMEHALRKNV